MTVADYVAAAQDAFTQRKAMEATHAACLQSLDGCTSQLADAQRAEAVALQALNDAMLAEVTQDAIDAATAVAQTAVATALQPAGVLTTGGGVRT